MTGADDDLLAQQVAYYGARAGEYDDWFNRIGRYDRGEEVNARWFSAVADLRSAIAGIEGERVLEVGCGTGLTTALLAGQGRRVTALDASAEMLDRCRERTAATPVTLVHADMYEWQPTEAFDSVVFTFVLSHVPMDRFEAFWARIGSWLAPGGSVFLADSLYTPESTAVDHQLEGPESETVLRRLDDGRGFRVVKVFHTPESLSALLEPLGWRTDLRTIGGFFYAGLARRNTRVGAAQ